MAKGKVFMNFMGEIQKAISQAKNAEGLDEMTVEFEKAVNRLGEVALHIGKSALSAKFKVAFAHAFPFLEVMGDVVMAWMLLWRAALARQKLNNGAKKKDVDFYEGQVKTAEFFILTLLPITIGKMNAIVKGNGAAVEISEAAFGG
jgi:hypothetical protein